MPTSPARAPLCPFPWQPAAVLVLGALLATACGDQDRRPRSITQRLIESEPQHLFVPAVLWPRTAAVEWAFAEPDDVAAWTLRRLKPVRGGAEGLVLRAGRHPELTWKADLEAAAIGRFELNLDAPPETQVRLLWTAEGETFSESRAIRFERQGSDWTCRVAGHRLWSGRVARLRLIMRCPGEQRLVLKRLAGIAASGDRAHLERQLEQAWKVDLGHEVRDALPAPPGLIRTWDVTPGDDAVLELAYGVARGVSEVIGFQVRVDTAKGREKVLLDELIDPTDPSSTDRWQQASVSLGRYAGQAIRLSFESFSPAPLELDRGLPFWASPVILEPDASGGS